MTGQDFQDKLDAIVADLQTKGKGRTVNIMFRNPTNAPLILPLSSDINGVVSIPQLTAIGNFLGDNGIPATAELYKDSQVPVAAAKTALETAAVPHLPLIAAARSARKAVSDAVFADAAYQTAKTAYETAAAGADFVASRQNYNALNVSENFAALVQARGEYAA